MDYWEKLDVRRYVNFEEFYEKNLKGNPASRLWMATTKAKRTYAQAEFGKDDYIMFGKESAGIRKNFWWNMRKPAFGFQCWMKSVP